MATGSQNMTTYNARIVTGSNSAASPAGALLLSGAGRADDATGDTWLFLDSRGGTSTPWGIKHDQANNQIQIFGAGTNSVWTQMNTGNTYIGGNLNTGSTLTVRAQNNTHEGGEIILSPATSSFVTVHVDAYDNLFRLHDGTNERFKVNVSTGSATINGNLGIGTDYAVSGGSYKLYVNGSSYFTNTITGDALSTWHMLGGRPANTTNFNTYFETAGNLHHDNPARTDAELTYNRFYLSHSDQTTYGPSALNLPVVDQHVLSFGIDNGVAHSRHIAFDIRTNAVYVRARNNSTWTNWEQIVRNTGTWGISITGNAATATALTSNAGGGEQPIYFTGGKPAATSYALKATVNNGTTGRLSYYSGDRAISATTNVHVLNNYLLSNSRNGASVDIRANGLIIWGQTYGNTANQMVSNTAGIFRFSDGGPQIVFNTSNGWSAQAGALIFTDHYAAATGASFHFVTTEGSDNNGGNLTVTAPRFRARKGLTIGQNSDNTSYNFALNGSGNIATGYLYINGGAGGIINGAATNGGLNSIRIGDDVWLGDCNQGGIMGMKSTGANTGFYFYNSSGTNTGQFYTNGTNFVCNKPISRAGVSVSWYQGRNNAIIKTTSYSGYDAILSMKTTAGDWSLGVYTDNVCYLTYILDSNYNAGTNTVTRQFYFKPDGTIGGSSFTGNSATTSKLLDSAHSWTATEVYNYMTARVLKAGDTMTGKLTISANVLPMLQLTRSDASEVSIYWANNTAGWAAGIHAWGVGAGQFAIGQYSGTGSSKWRLRIDNNGYVYTSSYLNLGGGHEKNASSPTYVWGSNSSDTYLRSYQTSHLSVSYAASAGAVAWANVSSKPATATRWPSWSEVTSKPTVQNNLTSTSTTDMLSAAQGKALNDKIASVSKVVDYTYAYGAISANGNLDITGTQLKVSTPSGYTPVAMTRFATGHPQVIPALFNARNTGSNVVIRLRALNSVTGGTVYISILYIRNS